MGSESVSKLQILKWWLKITGKFKTRTSNAVIRNYVGMQSARYIIFGQQHSCLLSLCAILQSSILTMGTLRLRGLLCSRKNSISPPLGSVEPHVPSKSYNCRDNAGRVYFLRRETAWIPGAEVK